MDSIVISRKKQLPDKVNILNKKTHSQKHSTEKIPFTKQQEIPKKTEPHIPQAVKFNKPPTETHSYTPLPTINRISKATNSSATVIEIHKDERICSVRAAIATFVITIILIIAAGVSVGIVFAVIKTQNSSETQNNKNNKNQNSFSTISSALLTSSISIGNQVGLPCSGYTEINDPTRNYTLVGSSSPCDNGQIFNTSNGGAWIRFVGTGGTRIPLSSPGMNHCGAYLSSWYNNTLPTVTNVINNGTVCFEAPSGLCGFIVDISVVYCPGNYYVYFLPRVRVCNARYCTY